LSDIVDKARCAVCGSEIDPVREQSKYLQIKLDLDIQLRESRQLRNEKAAAAEQTRADLRKLGREHDTSLSQFAIQFDLSSSPRESYLAQRNQRVGAIDQEIAYLDRLRDVVSDIGRLSAERAELQVQMDNLRARHAALQQHGDRRRRQALTHVSAIVKGLLRSDLPRQPEFQSPRSVSLQFRDDAILVDGEMHFAESSNVVLKNSAILALFSAAAADAEFCHPRFVLMDNVEDKGMEVERSHNFQRLIVEQSRNAQFAHQIIFTTSMIDPTLEIPEFVIGPKYSHTDRTLRLPMDVQAQVPIEQ
jgi:hypothetical protein